MGGRLQKIRFSQLGVQSLFFFEKSIFGERKVRSMTHALQKEDESLYIINYPAGSEGDTYRKAQRTDALVRTRCYVELIGAPLAGRYCLFARYYLFCLRIRICSYLGRKPSHGLQGSTASPPNTSE